MIQVPFQSRTKKAIEALGHPSSKNHRNWFSNDPYWLGGIQSGEGDQEHFEHKLPSHKLSRLHNSSQIDRGVSWSLIFPAHRSTVHSRLDINLWGAVSTEAEITAKQNYMVPSASEEQMLNRFLMFTANVTHTANDCLNSLTKVCLGRKKGVTRFPPKMFDFRRDSALPKRFRELVPQFLRPTTPVGTLI